MRWNDITENASTLKPEQKAANERLRQQQLAAARKAKVDAARDYQSDLQKADDKISRAITRTTN